MKRATLFLSGLLFCLTLYSHPWKPNHYVIIDTDGGVDDMKAITMFLASPDVRVLAVTVSPGALNEDQVYIKVKSLLNSFYHEGIPVGINRSCKFHSPDFPVAKDAIWGDESNLYPEKAPDFISVINDILLHEKTKVSFICLGGMSTVTSAIKEIPDFQLQVKEILWSAGGPDIKDQFNYKIDRAAAEKVMRGNVPVKLIQGWEDGIFYNKYLIDAISGLRTAYAKKISAFLKSPLAESHSFSYSLNDETVPLFLHYPALFRRDTISDIVSVNPQHIDSLRNGYLKVISGETVSKNQLIRDFPTDPTFYFADIEPSVSNIIEKFGIDEWISGVLANELHRHLGVFAIIGVKMGIRAREYFNTGVDEFSAESFAGSVPPLSCMNDGIQVSTGATPGHGLLKVMNDPPSVPVAVFTYMNRRIKLSLKPDIAEKISSELREINFVYGLDSNIYWELVRKNSINYWLSMDRHDIFIIEELK